MSPLVRVKRNDRWESVERDQLTDSEMKEFAGLPQRALELTAHGLGNIVPPFEILDGPEEQRELVAAAVPRLMALARAVRAALDGNLEKFEQNEKVVG